VNSKKRNVRCPDDRTGQWTELEHSTEWQNTLNRGTARQVGNALLARITSSAERSVRGGSNFQVKQTAAEVAAVYCNIEASAAVAERTVRGMQCCQLHVMHCVGQMSDERRQGEGELPLYNSMKNCRLPASGFALSLYFRPFFLIFFFPYKQ
jgi:hypothetical protein